MKINGWVIVQSIILMIIFVPIENRIIEGIEKETEIRKLPHELQTFPFSHEAIESIEIIKNKIIIIGQIYREKDTYNKINDYYTNKNLNDWEYDFSISDHAVTDGAFTLILRK